jgi:endo-1,4-beta-xylanase
MRKRSRALLPPAAMLAVCLASLGVGGADSLRERAAGSGRLVGSLAQVFYTDATNGDYVELLGDPDYSATLGTEFSLVALADDVFMDITQPSPDEFDFARADRVVEFAEAHDQRVRGTLVWDQLLPEWFEDGDWSRGQLKKLLKQRIRTVMKHYQGRVYAWDVVNEPVAGFGQPVEDDGALRRTIWSAIGSSYVELAHRTARKADPEALLCVNDNFHEDMTGDCCRDKSERVYELVERLASRHLVDCVGFQMHRDLDYVPDGLAENIRRYGDLGIEVQITEMDVRVPEPASRADLRKQAKIYQSVLGVCLAEPNCSSFVTWGFTDRFSWVPFAYPGFGSALPFDVDYRKKPAYRKLLKTFKKAG